MKVVIAGSRTLESIDTEFLDKIIITEVVSGTARGADKLGEEYAVSADIPVKRFPADWNIYGKAAGHIRNARMSRYADAAVVFIDNNSRGSSNMIEQMNFQEKPVAIMRYVDGKFIDCDLSNWTSRINKPKEDKRHSLDIFA